MLRDIPLIPVYDSAEKSIINDLIVPLLLNSKYYLRGVGYFSSGWLRVASEGLLGFAKNGSKAKIILSPIMDSNDWEAIELGSRARYDEQIKAVIARNIDNLAQSLESNTRSALAWMVADGLLDFRFAVPKLRGIDSDYHDKVGICIDDDEDSVAFHGSFNDSIKGTLNGEAFSVFCSWIQGQNEYVKVHQARLLSLWNGSNMQFDTFKPSDEIRKKFIKLRDKQNKPYSVGKQITALEPNINNPHCKVDLFPFQLEAIKKWEERGCRGIFEMATGTGKTFTALGAAVRRYEALRRVALIILVPYIHLLDQWKNHCKNFGFNPVLCSGDQHNWHLKAKSKVQDFAYGAIDSMCLLAVHATSSMDRFAKCIANLPYRETMLIGDEVHRLGAPSMQDALAQVASMRLGLSATPQRWYDPLGTSSLFRYFGEVCFEFPLDDAIKQEYLTPYEYWPELVSLTESESIEYGSLTARIVQHLPAAERNKEAEDMVEKLLLMRARLVWGAEEKLPRLLSLIRNLKSQADAEGVEVRDALVYCAPGTHEEILKQVSDLGLRCHEFVHTVSRPQREEILSQFAHGDIQVLISMKCLDEGVDVPSTQVAFILASSTNPREFVQRRGRILRRFKGKKKAKIYDFVVVPGDDLKEPYYEIGASLLRREMPRFAEFASSALNEFKARSLIRKVLNRFEMLDLLDLKPWDIYNNRMTTSDLDPE